MSRKCRKADDAEPIPPPTEVREAIWNSYMALAHSAALELNRKKARGLRCPGELGGSRMVGEKCRVARLLLLSVLAVEARANLLLWELKEQRLLKHLPTNNNFAQKWNVLANRARIPNKERRAEAIEWLKKYRDMLIHANFGELASETKLVDLPSAQETVGKYNEVLREIDFMSQHVRKLTFPGTNPKGEERVYYRWRV
jgi:hypothetical protein